MATLRDQIEHTLLPGMHIPQALELLFGWIEDHGLYIDIDNRQIGFLYARDKLKAGWTQRERAGGTDIEFFAEGNVNMKYWFGHDRPDVLNRLCVFARTGGEGSTAAFWLDNNGK